MLYFFILGQNYTLSVLEILAVLKQKKINYRIKGMSDEVLLIETNQILENLQERLGGTVKIGKADKIVKMDDFLLKEMINIFPQDKPKKIYFGFSLYKLDFSLKEERLKKYFYQIRKRALEIKKEFKKQGYASRWVISKQGRILSSVVVETNKLIKQGREIIFLIGKEKIYLGCTLSIQDFKDYSFRDYMRPARSMKVGMLPPKLAKIMINLAEIESGQTVLDPFCGLGTILAEAMIMGYRVKGLDIHKEAVENTKKNLRWLKNNDYEIIQGDVLKLSQKVSSIYAIVTEPYLGPPLQKKESMEKIEKIVKELSLFYLQVFQEFKKILQTNGSLVIVLPVFRTSRDLLFLPIFSEIKKMGFKLKKFSFLPFLQFTFRGTILYARPDQRVLREICSFTL